MVGNGPPRHTVVPSPPPSAAASSYVTQQGPPAPGGLVASYQPTTGGDEPDGAGPPLSTAASAVQGSATFWQTVWRRASVLVTLMLVQSLSQFVLERYEGLVAANIAIPLFLTMLVGAGGNAGNQASVRVIAGLSTGQYRARDWWRVVRREAVVGCACSVILGVMCVLRVVLYYLSDDDAYNGAVLTAGGSSSASSSPVTPAAGQLSLLDPAPPSAGGGTAAASAGMLTTVAAISLSLMMIVSVSVVLGAALPFACRRVGLNVEHAAPTIQVVMDITGVFITCAVCSAFLPTRDLTVTRVLP